MDYSLYEVAAAAAIAYQALAAVRPWKRGPSGASQ